MRYTTAGESHGSCLTAIVEGVPAGLRISEESINTDLARRQVGYGRSDRQLIEKDVVSISSGLRFGCTLGSPIALTIANKDWENCQESMAVFGEAPEGLQREVCPRPGHADLVGVQKIDSDDCRTVSERASARETAARVAVAGIAREFLADVGVEVYSYVTSIGSARMRERDPMTQALSYKPLEIEMSDVRCPNDAASDAMRDEIKKAKSEGESLGGTFRVVVRGLLPGLGGYASAHERLSSRLASALFSIPSIKGVEFGLGFEAAQLPGSQVHDAIELDSAVGFTRASNNAGGLEGGMTTGLPLLIKCAAKPIPTLKNPLPTINIDTLEPSEAPQVRSDVCAVPSIAVVAESEVAFVLANAYLDKFGGDNMTDIRTSISAYRQRLQTAAR